MSSPLAGCSILLYAQEPFTTHCMNVLLRDAGAEVISATSVPEAMHAMERQHLSAGVLDAGSASHAPHKIVSRLVRLGLPCLVCAHREGDARHPSGTCIIAKPVHGAELIETLHRLIREAHRAPSMAHERSGGRPAVGDAMSPATQR